MNEILSSLFPLPNSKTPPIPQDPDLVIASEAILEAIAVAVCEELR